MQRVSPVEIENQLAITMLDEAISNAEIKRVLTEISQILLAKVLAPIQQKVTAVAEFSQLDKFTQAMLVNLAGEHSAERRQYGAIMPEIHSGEVILKLKSEIEKLLAAHVRVLTTIPQVKTVEEMAVVLKTIVELGYTYYQEAPDEWHSANFAAIKQYVSPSMEENDIRLYRNELGEELKLATTFGIGTEANDLALKSEGKGRAAGKAAFGKVSMRARLQRLCDQYDATPTEKLAEKMAYYKIPLIKEQRAALDIYVAKWETFFEKLMQRSQLPFVASVSWATTRVLVTLQDLQAFNKSDSSFDFDKAQIVANCMMGFIVHAGHHSTAEVAEVYNRLLDYVAITYLEKHNQAIVKIEGDEKIERKLPYFHFGNYNSFFNRNYIQRLAKLSEPNNEAGCQLKVVV